MLASKFEAQPLVPAVGSVIYQENSGERLAFLRLPQLVARWHPPESLQAPRGISYLQPPITSTLASGLTAWLHVYELRPLVGYLQNERKCEAKSQEHRTPQQEMADSVTTTIVGRRFAESLENRPTLLRVSGQRAATFRLAYTTTAPRSRNNHRCSANPRAYCSSRWHPGRGRNWRPTPNASQNNGRYSNSLHMTPHHQAAG